MPEPVLTTIGHGTLEQEAFIELLAAGGVVDLVDVRSFPGSRRNPQFGREQMERWVPEAGIAYSWMRDLGGRRAPVADSPHVVWRNASFRAYADHMDTPAFVAAVGELLDGDLERTVMCSESVWWRCHRRLIADYVMLVCNRRVEHLMHDGRRYPHRPTEGVRRDGDRLVYDVGAARPLPGLG